MLTRGAFLAGWRLMSIDGFEWDAPDTPANAAELGHAGKAAEDPDRPAFPKVRVVTGLATSLPLMKVDPARAQGDEVLGR